MDFKCNIDIYQEHCVKGNGESVENLNKMILLYDIYTQQYHSVGRVLVKANFST